MQMDTRLTRMGLKTLALTATLGASQALVPLPASATTIGDDRRMSTMAAKIVGDADAARSAIAAHNVDAANAKIASAVKVRSAMAAFAKSHHLPMLVPVYSELDDTAVLAAHPKTAGHVSNSKTTAKSGASRTKAARPVITNIAQVTYLAIDLDATQSRLKAAQTALRNNNDRAARDSLAAIGSNLVENRVTSDLPLLTTRENLAQAQDALRLHQDTAAKADLQAAAKSLADYSRTHRDAAAQRLASAIDAAMPTATGDHPTLSGKIGGWWESVKEWFRHAA